LEACADCKPELKLQGTHRAEESAERAAQEEDGLDGVFSVGREQAGSRRLARLEASGQGCFGFGQALTAAGADAEFTGDIPQTAGAAFNGAADVTVGNGFAYAHNHGSDCERECE